MGYFYVIQQKRIDSSCCVNSGVTNHAIAFNTKEVGQPKVCMASCFVVLTLKPQFIHSSLC